MFFGRGSAADNRDAQMTLTFAADTVAAAATAAVVAVAAAVAAVDDFV